MILGRPSNLVAAAVTAILNVIFLVAAAMGQTVTPELIAAVNLAAAAIIALLASQPPTVNPGDTFKVTTPAGQPNEVRTA
jgi:hypothetical protein